MAGLFRFSQLVKCDDSFVSRKADQLKVEQALFNDYNDRIWLPWNNGGNSFKIHAGFSKFPIIKRAADLNHRQN